jgi:hypothetical protein
MLREIISFISYDEMQGYGRIAFYTKEKNDRIIGRKKRKIGKRQKRTTKIMITKIRITKIRITKIIKKLL